ncbi:MAG: peroxidase-related enzyme [bacterium]
MARIRVIEPDEATGELADIYADLTRSRGRLAEVHKIQSLNPQSIRDHMALYTTVMFSRSPLSRAEREMMAVVVSATNGCAYCIEHHGQALLHFWKDRGRFDALVEHRADDPALTAREAALCRYAELVTASPDAPGAGEALNALRAAGLDDRAVLDATLVVSYFNFVNRVVLALGVELESDAGGYAYE